MVLFKNASEAPQLALPYPVPITPSQVSPESRPSVTHVTLNPCLGLCFGEANLRQAIRGHVFSGSEVAVLGTENLVIPDGYSFQLCKFLKLCDSLSPIAR